MLVRIKTSILPMTLILLSSIMFSGCVSNKLKFSAEHISVSDKEQRMEESLKIGLVTDIGGIKDPFCRSALEGLNKAKKEIGINIDYKESLTQTDYSKHIEDMIGQECDLVWGIGFMMGQPIQKIAVANPNQKFAIIDYSYEKAAPKNLLSVTFKEHEAGFLVGYIAGKMTKGNRVGFIGGVDSSVIRKFHYGYKAGVRLANEQCEVMEEYSGSFSKPEIGREIASSMYSKGADIIFHAAGGTGNGLIQAAKEMNKYAIGVDIDQSIDAPEHVITSAMKRVDNAIYNTAKDLQEGRWNGGATIEYGLAEGGVDIAPSSGKLVSQWILDDVEKIKIKIIAGDIKVPRTKEEYEMLN